MAYDSGHHAKISHKMSRLYCILRPGAECLQTGNGILQACYKLSWWLKGMERWLDPGFPEHCLTKISLCLIAQKGSQRLSHPRAHLFSSCVFVPKPWWEHQCWGVGLETMQSREQLDQPMLGCLGGYFNDHLTIYQILSWWFTFFKKKKKEKNFFFKI